MKKTQERKAIVPYQANTIEIEVFTYKECKLKRRETWPRRRLKKTRKVIREMWALAFIYIYIILLLSPFCYWRNLPTWAFLLVLYSTATCSFLIIIIYFFSLGYWNLDFWVTLLWLLWLFQFRLSLLKRRDSALLLFVFGIRISINQRDQGFNLFLVFCF